jgi:hypothetical protein
MAYLYHAASSWSSLHRQQAIVRWQNPETSPPADTPQIKKGQASDLPILLGGTGGIARLSRCLRDSLVPHCIRDRPAGVLREQCSLVEPGGYVHTPHFTKLKNRPRGAAF